MTNSDTKKAMLFIVLGVILLGTGPMFVKFVQSNGILVGFYRLFFASHYAQPDGPVEYP